MVSPVTVSLPKESSSLYIKQPPPPVGLILLYIVIYLPAILRKEIALIRHQIYTYLYDISVL